MAASPAETLFPELGTIAGAAFGYILGFASQLVLEWLSSSRNQLSARLDELCADVRTAASAGCEYWLLENDEDNLLLLSAQIVGLQHAIEGMIAHLNSRIELDESTSAERLLFIEALTGGKFQVVGRPLERARIMQIHAAAAALIILLKKCRDDALRFQMR